MENFILINGRIFSIKFGIKSLMSLGQFLRDIDEQNRVSFLFHLGISYSNGNLTMEETSRLLKEYLKAEEPASIETLLLDNLNCSLNTHFEDLSSAIKNLLFSHISLNEQLEGLYQKAVGEIGIAPPLFYDMTPYEVELAYRGFLKKCELQSNCMLLALRKSQNNNPTLLQLIKEPEYHITSIEERNETFRLLGVKD